MSKNKKIFSIFFLVTLLSLCFLFVVPEFSHAQDTVGQEEKLDVKELSWGGSLVGWLAKSILMVGMIFVRKVSAVCLTAAMSMLDLMLHQDMFSQVFFSPTARAGLNMTWGLVRDFVNMFYILILLFLAIATILRVNRFSDKKLMLSVVGSALLVNFSQAITFVFIDASNLAMNFFSSQINSAGASLTTLMAQQMKISDLWTGNAFFNSDGALITCFSEIIFTMILAITIFVLAIALIIRMVAFWVLLVLSPLAFFGLALPGTGLANLWRSWFSRLISYAFFGPVLLFFLWLSLVMITALSQSKTAATIPGINETSVTAGDGLGGFVIKFFKNSIPFVAAIYLLFYGFSVSKDIAAKAGGAAGALFNKGQGWMGKAGKYAAIAGTGALGLGAYAGYSASKDYAAAKTEKLANSDSKLRVLTKKGREEVSKKRKEKWKGEGNEDYERGKANENYSTMKKDGLTEDEVRKNFDSKDKYRAAGAAKLAAENGWLKDQGDYEKAKTAATRVKGVGSQFENLAKRKNLKVVINSQLQTKAKELGYNSPNELYANNKAEADKILGGYTDGKGVTDFAEQGKDFFDDPVIQKHLIEKYQNIKDQTVKKNERKKVADKINDPELQAKVRNIIA